MMSKRRRVDGVANKTAFCVLDELSQSSICQELRDEFMCNKCKKKAEELDITNAIFMLTATCTCITYTSLIINAVIACILLVMYI